LKKLLGGDEAINSIVAGKGAVVERIALTIKGHGKNVIQADENSKVNDVTGIIEN
jgi:hypothetical protein